MSAHVTQPVQRRIEPGALTRGDEFAVLRVGPVFDHDGNELSGNVTDVSQLYEMERYFRAVQLPAGDLPLIDFNHMAVGGGLGMFAPLDSQIPWGAVVDMTVDPDDGSGVLRVVPGWTNHGRAMMDMGEGLLHPSATYRLDPIHDRATGKEVAGAALLAFALTPTPATRPDQLGQVRSAATAAESLAPESAETRQQEIQSMDELIAAFGALSPEDQAAFLDSVGAAGPDLDEERAQPDAPSAPLPSALDVTVAARSAEDVNAIVRSAIDAAVAPLVRQVRTLTAERDQANEDQVLNGMVARSQVWPADIGTAEDPGPARITYRHARDQFDRIYAGRAANHVRSAAVSPVGEQGQPEQAVAPPSDRNGFGAFVLRNQGDDETYDAALRRIGGEHPGAYQQAFGRKAVV